MMILGLGLPPSGRCLSVSVLSYMEEKDRDLGQEIRRVLDDRSRSFQEIFSRNKMLRRKIKARKSRQSNTLQH